MSRLPPPMPTPAAALSSHTFRYLGLCLLPGLTQLPFQFHEPNNPIPSHPIPVPLPPPSIHPSRPTCFPPHNRRRRAHRIIRRCFRARHPSQNKTKEKDKKSVCATPDASSTNTTPTTPYNMHSTSETYPLPWLIPRAQPYDANTSSSSSKLATTASFLTVSFLTV